MAKKTKKSVPTIVNFVLDQSGSMESIRDTVISSFNEYVNSLKKQKGKFLLSLTPFSTTVLPRIYDLSPLKDVKEMTRENYKPDDMTAMYDGIGSAVKYVEKEIETMKEKPAVLFVILTDGLENSSREYNAESVKKLIEEKKAEGNYQFIYLGANQDAWAVGQSMGIGSHNSAVFTATAMGTANVMRSMGTATTAFADMTSTSANTATTFDAFKDSRTSIASN